MSIVLDESMIDSPWVLVIFLLAKQTHIKLYKHINLRFDNHLSRFMLVF